VTFVVGIDGGGTRTRAVIVDASGQELGRGDSAGAVATADAPRNAADAVTAAVRRATEAAGVEGPAAALFAGLAGGGGEAARMGVATELEKHGLAGVVVVGTDVEAAFEDAFPDGPGVLLIAGTGSIAWARDTDGVVHRAGGWGQHVGDEGSGYALGASGLRLVTRAHDGRARETALTEALLGATASEAIEALIPWSADASKSDIAALAPLVVAAADEGDDGASAIVDSAVLELVAHAEALRVAVGVNTELVLWGGLLADGGPLGGRTSEALEREGWSVSSRPVDPPMGAARIALATVR